MTAEATPQESTQIEPTIEQLWENTQPIAAVSVLGLTEAEALALKAALLNPTFPTIEIGHIDDLYKSPGLPPENPLSNLFPDGISTQGTIPTLLCFAIRFGSERILALLTSTNGEIEALVTEET